MHVTRLDRKQAREGLETQKHEYSFEELVAELTACYLGNETGILTEDLVNNSASYLQSWIKPLQNNPDWILKASSQASKAFNYITGNLESQKA
jgi:antirestriction protein ArdC